MSINELAELSNALDALKGKTLEVTAFGRTRICHNLLPIKWEEETKTYTIDCKETILSLSKEEIFDIAKNGKSNHTTFPNRQCKIIN